MGVGHDWLERHFLMSGAWFVLLASRASSHIVFREVFHSFALIRLTKKVYGVRYSRGASEGVVMVRL